MNEYKKIFDVNLKINFRFSVNNIDKKFYEHLKDNYNWLNKFDKKITNYRKIEVKFMYKKCFLDKNNLKKISKNIYLGKDQFLFYYEDWLVYNLKLDDETNFQINVFYSDQKFSIIEVLLRILLKRKTISEIESERFIFMTRMIFHFPIFYILTNKYNCLLLHASTVAKINKAYIFFGLDGIGKSTLAFYMQKHGYEILSDNFSIIDSNYIYPMSESSRLSDTSLDYLNMNKTKIRKKIFERNLIKVPSCEQKNIKISGIIIQTIDKNIKIKKINTEMFMKYLLLMNDILPEFIDYNFFKSITNIIDSNDETFNNHESIYKIIDSHNIYILTKNDINNLDQIRTIIEECI